MVLLTILSFSVDFTQSQCKDSSLPTPIMVWSRHIALNKIPVFWLPESHLEPDALPWTLLYVHQISPHAFLAMNSRTSLPELLSVGLSQRCWGHPVSGQVLQSPRWPLSPAHTWLPFQEILLTLPSAAPSSSSSLFLVLHFLGGLLP